MQIFDSKTTEASLSYQALIPAIEQMFLEQCETPLRHNHRLSPDDGNNDTLLIMPAWIAGRYLGIKHVTIFSKNHHKGIPGLHSTYTLFDASNGVPLAIIDGDQITIRRTAAASALAAKFLSRVDSRKLLVVGAGRVASALPWAYATVRNLTEVSVWDIDSEKAKQLVRNLRQDGFNARHVEDLQDGARAADIISCATLSEEPLIKRDWLSSGCHLDLIGGFQPFMREADDATFADTSVFIDTDEALKKAGDLLSPIKAKVFSADRVLGRLDDLCKRRHAGRKHHSEITVYKAVGTASEDLAAAILVYESAKRIAD
jgi:ornithine cyclodeaminase/alanine dehydrogenase-like protein (mu-crystallin family)